MNRVAFAEAPGLDGWFRVEATDDAVASVRLVPARGAAPADAPPLARALAERLAAHAAGDLQDFRDVPLAWARVTPFQRRVLEALREVPAGARVTYGELARRAGLDAGASRAVGATMAANPWLLVVPCHRVLPSGGGLGNYSGHGGPATKRKLLAVESPLTGIPGPSRSPSPPPSPAPKRI